MVRGKGKDTYSAWSGDVALTISNIMLIPKWWKQCLRVLGIVSGRNGARLSRILATMRPGQRDQRPKR